MRGTPRKTTRAAAAAALLALIAAGCSSGEDRDADTVRIAYQKFGTFIAMDSLMRKVKE